MRKIRFEPNKRFYLLQSLFFKERALFFQKKRKKKENRKYNIFYLKKNRALPTFGSKFLSKYLAEISVTPEKRET